MKTATVNSPSLFKNKDDFSKGIIISFTLHIGIVLFFTLKTFLFADEIIDYTQAIRVDLVGLPEKITQDQIAPKVEDTKPIEKEITKPVVEKKTAKPLPAKTDPDTINLDKTKLKQKEALQKLKTMSAIEKIQQEIDKEKRPTKTAKVMQVKGNVLAPGTELTGLDRLQHENYASSLDKHVKQYWSIPEWLAHKGYNAQAIVRINEQGQILSRQIVKSSGNANFDESVLETIDQANPLPAPPEKLSAKVRVEGILIGFGE